MSERRAVFERLLSRPIDNTYRGSQVALWLFGVVVGLTVIQGVFAVFNGYSTVMNADGIPLDTYPGAAAQTIVALWAQRGLSRLIISLLAALVLVRYRSAVPFMFALLLLNYLASQLVFRFVPVVRTGTPPGPIVNLMMLALMIIGLGLSLWKRGVQA